MEIINKTKRPLRIPLPGGKRLHLGPGRTGKVSPKAADHPALKELIDAGEIEVLNAGKARGSAASSGTGGVSSSQNGAPSVNVRHVGDR